MNPDAAGQAHIPIPAPPGVGSRLVRYILGFGVGVGVGLAPYLGAYQVPLFRPMLALIPNSLREPLLPLSAALMGILAVAIQWYQGESVSRAKLRRLFTRTLIMAASALLVLFVVHRFVVIRVPTFGGKSVTILKGFVRPVKYPCEDPNLSELECLDLVTLSEERINTFYGDTQMQAAAISLSLLYLLFTASFGMMIGLIILREVVVSKREHVTPPQRQQGD